ncbi:MAG TPA: site-2 protease family protein [Thermoanaerobaculia bacterium]|nr:site-2 protease family protein [Thermoanaerobaculia bacterium]
MLVILTRTDLTTDLDPWLTPAVVSRVWHDPALLGLGLRLSLPLLVILLAHEMGHYVVCRRYGVIATLPYFLPLPAMLGTLGAFIRIRTPIRNKRELFDIGIAGPIAGFVALLPFLLYGVARSRPGTIPPASTAGTQLILAPGRCLALQLATLMFHGRLPKGVLLDLHPFAIAAWFGLLATALNLLPLAQLDGGHILYAAIGSRQRRLAWPLWILLAAAGLLWPGWWLWCVIVLAMGLKHPPVADESTPLDPRRRRLALVALLLFALSFMPVPLKELIFR